MAHTRQDQQTGTPLVAIRENLTPDSPTQPTGRVVDRLTLAVQRATVEILQEGRTLANAIEVASQAQAFAEKVIEEAKARTNAPPVDCKAGCPWCCHVTVTTTIPEVLQIAEWIRGAIGGEERASVRLDSIDEYVGKVAGMSLAERSVQRQRCPIQDPASAYCSLWPIRPLLCRSWTSADVSKCREAYFRPRSGVRAPVLRVQRDVAQSIGAGIVAGLRVIGVEHGAVYLVDALQIALADPSAADRWLAGEPVFRDAEVGEGCLEAVAGACESTRTMRLPVLRLVREDAGREERDLGAPV